MPGPRPPAAPVHPELRRIARLLPRGGVSRRSLPAVRALAALQSRLPSKGVGVERVGPISVRVHRPPEHGTGTEHGTRPGTGAGGALLWIHGGGYVLGTASQDDIACRHLARALGIMVVSVDYRLAPEHRFPVPLHDCYHALTWLASHPAVDPGRIAVGGASAGGGLAAALAILARDRAEVRPAVQVLVYPMLDDRTATRTDVDERGFRLWNLKADRFGWEAYTGLPPGSAGISGLASPARCEDLAGLPPAWIGVGTLDLFHTEDVAYAHRLRDAGVPCDLEVVEGAFHGFDGVAKTAVGRAFRAAQVKALAGALNA